MLLSVHKRTSRLACLGELGRYPIMLKGLLLAVKYEWHLKYKADKSSLAYAAYKEMSDNLGDSQECWLTRVEAIKSMFGIELHGGMSSDGVSQRVKKALQSKYEIFWKDQINDEKFGQDNVSHNKLRFYCQLKSCFSQEPYIKNVTNRSQRSWLSRVRTSAHSLGIERGRYSGVPLADRICVYCAPTHEGVGDDGDGPSDGVQAEVDSEIHFLMRCPRFKYKRTCFLKRLECLVPATKNMPELDLVKTILCPVKPQTAKLVDKYMGIMFKARADIDAGKPVIEYPSWEPNQPNPFAQSDAEDEESHLMCDECDCATTSSSDDSLLSQ